MEKGSEATQFKKGNRDAEKWSLEDAQDLFYKAFEFAQDSDECLCVEDAIHHTKIPYSTFYNLIKKYPVLDNIKEDVKKSILRRINKGGLLAEFNPAMSIWRLKQLGEHDKQIIEQQTTITELTQEERKEKIKRLKGKM